MKKQLFGILTLIVSITLLISLVSCSNKPSGNVDDDAPLVRDDSTGSTSAPENNAGNVPDFSAIMAGNRRDRHDMGHAGSRRKAADHRRGESGRI